MLPVLGMVSHTYVAHTHFTYRTCARCQFSGWPPMIPVLGMVAHTYVAHSTLYLSRARRAEPVLGMAARSNS